MWSSTKGPGAALKLRCALLTEYERDLGRSPAHRQEAQTRQWGGAGLPPPGGWACLSGRLPGQRCPQAEKPESRKGYIHFGQRLPELPPHYGVNVGLGTSTKLSLTSQKVHESPVVMEEECTRKSPLRVGKVTHSTGEGESQLSCQGHPEVLALGAGWRARRAHGGDTQNLPGRHMCLAPQPPPKEPKESLDCDTRLGTLNTSSPVPQ